MREILVFGFAMLALAVNSARADYPYSCLIVGGDSTYMLDLDDPFANLTIHGLNYTGEGDFDSGEWTFGGVLPIGQYGLHNALMKFSPADIGGPTLGGSLTSSDNPPIILQMGCTSDDPPR
jgi:hypothetical protein